MTIRVNGREISQHDIDQESAAFSGGDPHQARQQATAALIIRTLLLDHSQQGWEADEATADAAIEALLAREIVAPVPTIAACRRYYQANLERFHSPPLVAARHILLAAPPDDPEQRERARIRAEHLLGLLQTQPERFAELAASHSACPSKTLGGQLGQLSRGQTVPELDDVLLRLPLGLAAKPLTSRYGYHIVEILERAEGMLLPFATALPRIRDYLTAKAQHHAVHQYLQRLLGEARIEGIDVEAVLPWTQLARDRPATR